MKSITSRLALSAFVAAAATITSQGAGVTVGSSSLIGDLELQ